MANVAMHSASVIPNSIMNSPPSGRHHFKYPHHN